MHSEWGGVHLQRCELTKIDFRASWSSQISLIPIYSLFVLLLSCMMMEKKYTVIIPAWLNVVNWQDARITRELGLCHCLWEIILLVLTEVRACSLWAVRSLAGILGCVSGVERGADSTTPSSFSASWLCCGCFKSQLPWLSCQDGLHLKLWLKLTLSPLSRTYCGILSLQ